MSSWDRLGPFFRKFSWSLFVNGSNTPRPLRGEMTGFSSPSSHLDPIFPMGQMQEPVTGSHVTPPLHWHRWLHPWPKVPWAHTTWGKEENEGIKTIFSNSLLFQLSSYKQHVLVSCSQQLTALLIAYGAQQQQILIRALPISTTRQSRTFRNDFVLYR